MMIAELVVGKLCSKSASVQALLARKGWTRVRNSRFMDAPFAGGGEFTANANARRAETTPITKTGLMGKKPADDSPGCGFHIISSRCFNQAALPHEDSNYTRRYLARYGGHFARPCPMQ
jgi:hypothetical protein